jgi:large subunit ribosomal protein L4
MKEVRSEKSQVNIPVVTMEGKPAGEFTLNNVVFGYKIHRGLVTEGVLSELANRRVGTHAAKTRAFVSGGGRKPWKQKGTGRARQGSIRSPQWRHGAVIFPPVPREHGYDLPKNQRKSALKSALSSKVKEGSLVVVDDIKITEPKTKNFVKFLNDIHVSGTALVVLHGKDENVVRSARNIPGIKLAPVSGVTIFDVLKYKQLVMTQEAVQQLEQRLVKN